MVDFKIHDETTAPEISKDILAAARAQNGFVPGLYGVMAESPQLLQGYQALHAQFMNSSFDTDEKTVVWQTINVEHECHYCVPAHSGIAKSMGVDDAVLNALRDETPLPTPRLEALRKFTLIMVRTRGEVADADAKAFLDAGFTTQNILDVVLCLAQKVMSNYTNHLAQTPVDDAFQSFAWSKTE